MEDINTDEIAGVHSVSMTETDLENLRSCTLRDCVIVLKADGTIDFINPQAQEELYISDAKVVGMHYSSFFILKYKEYDCFPEVLASLKDKAGFIQYQNDLFIHCLKNGSRFPAICKITGLFDQGCLKKIVILFLNIKEERMQSYFLNMTLNSTKIFPWFYDMERSVYVMTPEYFTYLKLPNDHHNELTAEEFVDLVFPDDRESLFSALSDQMGGDLYTAPVSFRLRRGDGTYEWMEGRSTYLAQEVSGLPYRIVGIVMSIQKMKDKEEEVAVAKRNDAQKSAFLANMSHEIRTPLNSIVGFSMLLRDIEGLEKNEIVEFVDIINKNCELLLSLINDILDISKIEAGTMEFRYSEQSLNKLLDDIYVSQQLNMPPGVELKLELAEKDKIIFIDPVRLKQVINNLINNAVKFTNRGYITFGYLSETPGNVTFFVKDTGKGISEEDQKHIFDRFYKIDHFSQGAGLGLAICRTIVEYFHGTIHIESKKGVGTCFKIVIPEKL
ncbi:ATP-binding protein [Parabacteroides sp. APC149_11_2_Y6]